MRITDVRVAEAPLDSPMRNAVVDFSTMTVSIVAIETDHVVNGERVIGYGFNSNGRYAQTGLLTSRLLPRLRAAAPADLVLPATGLLDPVAARNVLLRNEKPGGYGDRSVAIGMLDMALCDAASKAAGMPLYRWLHQRFSPATRSRGPAEQVWVYAAGGYYYPNGSIDDLRIEMERYLELGYRDVKLKIGGADLEEDLARIDAVRAVLPAEGGFAVDANGRFDLPTALRYARELADRRPLWFEEPCDPSDFLSHAALAENYPGRLATGENLFAEPEVRNLLRYAGLRPGHDVIQVDPALAAGVSEYAAILDTMSAAGWGTGDCCPHGGHLFNLAIAAAFGLGGCESYPGVFAPFGGFSDDEPIRDGMVRPPSAPGLGVEGKSALHRLLRDRLART